MAGGGTIVLGYDASPGAERALVMAIDLARQYGDHLIIAFGAAPPGQPTRTLPSTGAPSRRWGNAQPRRP